MALFETRSLLLREPRPGLRWALAIGGGLLGLTAVGVILFRSRKAAAAPHELKERRVRVKDYRSLPKDSPLLVEVGTRRLHKLAAANFHRLAKAIEDDLDLKVKLASAWRRHKWESWEDYEKKMIAKYGSVREGRKWMAYTSPHETGLAIDFGSGGLTPNRKTVKKQRETDLYKWLAQHAHEYGWYPYLKEPWHWEHPVTSAQFESGTW